MQRWIKDPQISLFNSGDVNPDRYCYHAVATNSETSAQEFVWWHNGRGNSENYNKELMSGIGMERMPCGQFSANAMFLKRRRINVQFNNCSKIVIITRRMEDKDY